MLYMAEHGIGTRTAPEAKLRMRGDWRLSKSSGRYALTTRTWPKRLTSKSLLPCSMSTPSTGPVAKSATPALLMRTSSPAPLSAAATRRAPSCTMASSVTSCSMGVSVTSRVSSEISTPGSTPANTRQPRCASLRAMSMPMPMAAPVTTADRLMAAAPSWIDGHSSVRHARGGFGFLQDVDESPGERGAGIQALARERQVGGALAADAPRQAHAATGAGNEPVADLGQLEEGIRSGLDAAPERGHLDAGADRCTVNAKCHTVGAAPEERRHRARAAHRMRGRRVGCGAELGELAAGAEAGARAADGDLGDGAVGNRQFECLEQGIAHAHGERVAPFGTVEPQVQ